MLWEEHEEMIGVLDDLFWEDQKVWYKCIDEKNEGIIVEKGSKVSNLMKYDWRINVLLVGRQKKN